MGIDVDVVLKLLFCTINVTFSKVILLKFNAECPVENILNVLCSIIIDVFDNVGNTKCIASVILLINLDMPIYTVV
jgi:hypothetical protein